MKKILFFCVFLAPLHSTAQPLESVVEKVQTLNKVSQFSFLEQDKECIDETRPSLAESSQKFMQCNLQDWKLNDARQPKVWGIEGQSPKHTAVSVVGSLLTEVTKIEKAGKVDCTALQLACEKIFANNTAMTWDDFVTLNILKENLGAFLSHPKKLLSLGIAAEMSAGLRPGDHDDHKSSKLRAQFDAYYVFDTQTQALDYRNSIIQLTLEELAKQKIDGAYEGIPKMSPEDRSAALKKISQSFVKLFNAEIDKSLAPSIIKKSREYAQNCDKKLSQIFGNGSKTRAAGSGWDRQRDKKNKVIGDYSLNSRFHTCSSMHMYSQVDGPDSQQMFYLPAGCSTGGSGTGKRCRSGKAFRDENGKCLEYSESFPSRCQKLGRLKNVNIMVAHISIQGRDVPKIKNEAGSLPVGYLAGPGGESNDGYGHSHIQLTGGGYRISFSDAVCRSGF